MVLQDTGFAPAPVGTGQPFRPAQAPQRAPGPRSHYNPIFNPIIAKSDPSTAATNMQTQARALTPPASPAHHSCAANQRTTTAMYLLITNRLQLSVQRLVLQ